MGDKEGGPAQINISYSKKLQDNIKIRKQPDRQKRRKACKGKQPGPKTAAHPSPGTKPNSNPKISSAEGAPGGTERDKDEEKGTLHNGAFSETGHISFPMNILKIAARSSSSKLIWNTALTAARAKHGIMFYSTLSTVNNVLWSCLLAQINTHTGLFVCVFAPSAKPQTGSNTAGSDTNSDLNDGLFQVRCCKGLLKYVLLLFLMGKMMGTVEYLCLQNKDGRYYLDVISGQQADIC